MSVTYFLVRVKEGATAVSINSISEHTTLPFGPLEDVKLHLLGSERFEDRSDELERLWESAARMGIPVTRPSTPMAKLLLEGTSDEHEVMLQGDPVTSISINRCAPSEFLVITDLLKDLAPFAILCDSSEEVIDPESLRPRDPESSSESIFADPAPAKNGIPGLLVPRWQVEGKLYSSRPPIPSVYGFIVVSAGGGVTVLDADTGSTLWTRTVHERHMTATLAKDLIVLAGNHPQVFGLSLRDGSISWRLSKKGQVFAPDALLPTGHMALVSRRAKERGEVTVLEPTTGTPVWRASIDHARSTSVATSGPWLLVAGGNHVHGFDPRTGKPMGRREIPPKSSGRALIYPAVVEMCGCGGRAIILHTHGLESWAMPGLEEGETLMELGFAEACLGLCANHVVAGGRLPNRGPVVLRVFAPPSFDVVHEIEIHGNPATPVDLGGGRCACLVRAPRQDPLQPEPEGEAHILIFETSSGRILHEEPLGSSRWYPGHLAAVHGRLYATYCLPGPCGSGRAFLRAYDVH